MQFCSLSFDEAVSDEITLCHFRNRLIQAGELDWLLAEINRQLQHHSAHTAPANQSEVKHLAQAVEKNHIQVNRIYTDKGSASQENRHYLQQRKIKSAIMYKAQRNKPLTEL